MLLNWGASLEVRKIAFIISFRGQKLDWQIFQDYVVVFLNAVVVAIVFAFVVVFGAVFITGASI